MTKLEYYFYMLNGRYFRGRLKNVQAKWSKNLQKKHWMGRTRSSYGECSKKDRRFLIEIDSSLRRYESVVIFTLIHEMVHVEQWDRTTDKTCHGRLFQRRMKDLAMRGAFSGLW